MCPGGNPVPCPTLSLATPGAGAMASKPEKRVASSVFITLAPPRRDVAVAEEVRQAVCEAWRGRPWAAPAPVKTPEAGLARRPSPWTPPGKAATTVPAAPLQLSNGGKSGRDFGKTRSEAEVGRKGQAPASFIHSFVRSLSAY